MVKIDLHNYRKIKKDVYEIHHFRLFGIKFEWCIYHKKYMFRIEMNNWDK
jgi:hypothetical protein